MRRLRTNQRSCLRHRNYLSNSTFLQYNQRCGFHDRRIVVSGLGLVTPLGLGAPLVWERLLRSSCGVRHIQPEIEIAKGMVAAQVPSVHEDPKGAASEAITDSGLANILPSIKMRTGVSIGSGIGAIEATEEAHSILLQSPRRMSPFTAPRMLVNLSAGAVSQALQVNGPNIAPAGACAAGAQAIGEAMLLIKAGMADVMIAGGTEAAITPLTLTAFSRARALSTAFSDNPSAASRPFDEKRDGFVMGEGSGIVVLESLDHALARGAKIYSEIVGYGATGDAYHVTMPHPESTHTQHAMAMALNMAGIPISSPSGASFPVSSRKLELKDVGYVNAHATGTPLGDVAEAKAIANIFPSSIKVSSTKGATGHLLGAAGAVEAIFTIQSLLHRIAPPTVNLSSLTSDFPELNYIREATSFEEAAALSNAFGFGGTNTALLFKKYEQ